MAPMQALSPTPSIDRLETHHDVVYDRADGGDGVIDVVCDVDDHGVVCDDGEEGAAVGVCVGVCGFFDGGDDDNGVDGNEGDDCETGGNGRASDNSVDMYDNDDGGNVPDVVCPQAQRSKQEQRRKLWAKAKSLIRKCDIVIANSKKDLEDAREILEPAGFTVDSSILDPTFGALGSTSCTAHSGGTTTTMEASKMSMPTCAVEGAATATTTTTTTVMRTTGGHSNTDHLVKITGNPRKDRIEELKRNYQRRMRAMQPEYRGEDRWDKPKIPGERRRRIVREKDAPRAPPEPPQTGYIIFLGQMTTKIRHDRPDEPHCQTKVIQEISKIWKLGMSESERDYYNEFAREARNEYQRLLQEYRATGRYQPSDKFEKLQGVGPWVRVVWHEKNGLERELSTYETVSFPPRPPQLNQAYEERRRESIKRRKFKHRTSSATMDSGDVAFEEDVEANQSETEGNGEQDVDDDDYGYGAVETFKNFDDENVNVAATPAIHEEDAITEIYEV